MSSKLSVAHYNSPLGTIIITADDEALISLQFSDNHHCGSTGYNTIICQAISWLDEYFAGRKLPSPPPIKFQSTDFRVKVWRLLLTIPYGSTVSYADIARQLGSSPRAVGSAVARNPILLIVPCHRVIATNGSLTGFAAGLDRKRYLLEMEVVGHSDEVI